MSPFAKYLAIFAAATFVTFTAGAARSADISADMCVEAGTYIANAMDYREIGANVDKYVAKVRAANADVPTEVLDAVIAYIRQGFSNPELSPEDLFNAWINDCGKRRGHFDPEPEL